MSKKLFLLSTVFAGLLSTGLAHAADLPRPAPLVSAPAFTWAGLYLGANVGAGWGTKEWASTSVLTQTNYGMNGALAGGQIGYNWQAGWVVLGVEADANWADLKGKGSIWASTYYTSKVDSLGTIVGRIGGTFDRALLYVLAGGAWAHQKDTFTIPSVYGTSSTDFRWGWTLGGGVELAFTPQWSGKIQYNYLDFGTNATTFIDPRDGRGFTLDLTQRIHTVKVGLNYHFWTPVVARY